MDKKVVLMATTILVLILLLPGCVSKQALQPFKTQMHTSGYIDINTSLSQKPNFPFTKTVLVASNVTPRVYDEFKNGSDSASPVHSLVGGQRILFTVSALGNLIEYANGSPFRKSEYFNSTFDIIQYGIAPSYLSAEYANEYCLGGLGVTKFLVSSNGTPYQLPDPRLATCYLDHGRSPRYFFYTVGGKHANVTALVSAMERTAELMGREFRHENVYGNVGPIVMFIDPKVDYDAPGVSKKLVTMVHVVAKTCPTCYVGIGIDFNDSAENYAFYKDPNVYKVIQAIRNVNNNGFVYLGVDVDSRHFSPCTDPHEIWFYFMNFTHAMKYAVMSSTSESQSHPLFFQTIVPYVYFEQNLSCGISGLDVAQAYSELFTFAPGFWYGGAVHYAAVYQPVIGDDPLGVLKNSKEGYLLPPSILEALSHSTSNSHDEWWNTYYPANAPFFGYCRAYYSTPYEALGNTFLATIKNKLKFTDEQEDLLTNTVTLRRLRVVPYDNLSGFYAVYQNNIQMLENLSLGHGLIQDRYITFDIDLLTPSGIPSTTLSSRQYTCIYKPMFAPPTYLSKHKVMAGLTDQYGPLIGGVADRFDMDPELLYSVVSVNSGFNKDHILYVPKSDKECNPLDMSLKEKGIAQSSVVYVVDKRRVGKNMPLCVKEEDVPKKDRGEVCKPCYFGLAPVEFSPGSWYMEHHKPMPDAVRYCGGGKFDPLNPEDNLCAFAYQYNQNLLSKGGTLDLAIAHQEQINDYVGDVSEKSDNKYMVSIDKVLWVATFMALNPRSVKDDQAASDLETFESVRKDHSDETWFKYFGENGTYTQQLWVRMLEAYVGEKEAYHAGCFRAFPPLWLMSHPWQTCIVPYTSVLSMSSDENSYVSPAEQANREESENAEKNKGG